MSGWDVGLLPFARNESTRFISPTKTPEYLAAGLPVVSTSITDVVRPYGSERLVHIADECDEFVACAEHAIATRDSRERLKQVDAFLAHNSWDRTWKHMFSLIHQAHSSSSTAASSSINAISSALGSGAAAD
jgi:UDP-galactopyranose mutase